MLPNPQTTPAYRPDIDGLRAVAVLAVLGYHAFPAVIPGGFVGVDVFFVISGFLITTLILEDLQTGSFSLLGFYQRRVRRIFPALSVVLLATWLCGWQVLLAGEYQQLGRHLAAGAGFVANLVLWQETGYFDTAAESKPLLHLWSLGIEEQFYLLWPLLLLGLWRARAALGRSLLLMGLASLLLCLVLAQVDAQQAFFSPLTRFWELLAGTSLAWGQRQARRLAAGLEMPTPPGQRLQSWRTLRPFGLALADGLSGLGLLLILLSVMALDRERVYPGAWTLLPVLGTVLLILAGAGAAGNRLLARPWLVGIGLISYPLYLWHWPALSFLRIQDEAAGPGRVLAALLLALLLAGLTWRWIERPCRQGGQGARKAGLLVLAMALLGTMGLFAWPGSRLAAHSARLQAMQAQLGWALPVASPAQIEACRRRYPERRQLVSAQRDDDYCYLQKDAPAEVLLVGDSLNLSLFPGLSQYDDYNLLLLSASMAVPIFDTRSALNNGKSRRENWLLAGRALHQALHDPQIRVVLLSFMHGKTATNPDWGVEFSNLRHPEWQGNWPVFSLGLADTLQRLLAAGKRVIYVLPNPALSQLPARCLREYRKLGAADRGVVEDWRCTQPLEDHLRYGDREYRQALAVLLQGFPQVRLFDAAAPFCDERECRVLADGELFYRDLTHLSQAGSARIAPALHQMIRAELAAGR
jgi:peptidoglycan/LPS O-acetylase OafA/YrhL